MINDQIFVKARPIELAPQAPFSSLPASSFSINDKRRVASRSGSGGVYVLRLFTFEAPSKAAAVGLLRSLPGGQKRDVVRRLLNQYVYQHAPKTAVGDQA